MDCAAEERLVRLALEGRTGIDRLAFDLPARRLTVWHEGDAADVLAALGGLRLGARLERSEDAAGVPGPSPADAREGSTLRVLLAINAVMFVVGAVDPDEVFRLADRYFAPLAAQPAPPPVTTREPPQLGERRFTVQRDAQTPIIAMAGAYETFKLIRGENGTAPELGPLVFGMLAALISGLAAIHYLLRWLSGHSLNIFVWYRIVLAAIVVFWFLNP